MDKRVIFAVAGSGKTTRIIKSLNLEDNSLIVTYTNNNLHNLRTGIINEFGFMPSNIKLFSYYSFLHSFCYKPFLFNTLNTKGINFEMPFNLYAPKTKRAHYIDKYNRIYSNRISKILLESNEIQNINNRISKYFKNLFIDEIQDFSGNDFNFLKGISQSNLNILFVGDFYQHTFGTSRDGNVNKSLHNEYQSYQSEFEKMNLTVDLDSLNKSWRCSPTVCKFITEKVGINIESHNTVESNIIEITDKEDAKEIYSNNEIVKLFYREHYKYNCFSRNWGDSKGEDKYYNVCVVLNDTTLKHFKKNELNLLKPTTKNKFYVAISRAKNDIYFMKEKLIKEYKM